MSITAEQALALPLEAIVLEHYLPAVAARRKPNTVYGYESSIRRNVLPRWAGLTLAEIERDDVQAWVDSLAAERGPGGAVKAYKCLRQVIRWSRRKWGLYVLDPTEGIELPERPAARTETLTQRRLKRAIRGMVGCPHEPTYVLSAALGLRPSESYFLRWESIDWRSGRVAVRGALLQVAGRVYESTTKTKHSERDLYLPPWALDRLHEIWVERGRPKGRIIGEDKPTKVYSILKRWAIANRLPWVGMRNLRHTWATIAAASGVAIELVAGMLGHSNINTCYRYYLALTKRAMTQAQRRVARTVLGRTKKDMYEGTIIRLQGPPEALPAAA